MQDVLRELFDDLYEGKIGSHPMTAEEYQVWDRVQEAFSGDFVDELVYAQSRSIAEGRYDSFRLGFRLGALLMLELN